MVKEMQTNEAIWSTSRFGQRIDAQRGGVRSENCVFVAYLIEGREHSGFDIEVFENSLDNKVGIFGDVFGSNNTGDSSFDLLCLSLAKDSPFNRFIKKISNNRLTAFNPLLLTVNHLYIELLLGRFLGDSRAHVSSTDDCYTSDRSHGSATKDLPMNPPIPVLRTGGVESKITPNQLLSLSRVDSLCDIPGDC